MLPQQLLDYLDRIPLKLFLLPAVSYLDVSPAGPHLHVGARSQKGVAADLLAALHRFQQECVRLIGGNRGENGNPASANRPPPISPPAPAWPLRRAGKIPCNRDEAWSEPSWV